MGRVFEDFLKDFDAFEHAILVVHLIPQRKIVYAYSVDGILFLKLEISKERDLNFMLCQHKFFTKFFVTKLT